MGQCLAGPQGSLSSAHAHTGGGGGQDGHGSCSCPQPEKPEEQLLQLERSGTSRDYTRPSTPPPHLPLPCLLRGLERAMVKRMVEEGKTRDSSNRTLLRGVCREERRQGLSVRLAGAAALERHVDQLQTCTHQCSNGNLPAALTGP